MHEITSVVPDGPDTDTWTCRCGSWGTCQRELTMRITSEHVTHDGASGPTALHMLLTGQVR